MTEFLMFMFAALCIYILSLVFIFLVYEFKPYYEFYEKNRDGKNESNDEELELDIEYFNNMFYVYEMESRKYLAQGADLLTLNKNLKERFPNVDFDINEEEFNKLKPA